MAVLVASLAPAHAQVASREAVVAHYAAIVSASYDDTLAAAKSMQRAIQAFAAKPTSTALEEARRSWLAAREWYGQTEAFRFYGGPIDDARGPEPRINSWPIDESYVDAVRGKPNAGIINNPGVPITKRELKALNGRDGQENIATGWHAIEFLLWGQDFNDNGAGNRSHEDFLDGKAPNARRRREYLLVATSLLIDDLAYVANAWRAKGGAYRRAFEKEPEESLRRMFVGLVSLARGEMAGERMEVPLATQDQEDEQSCFSDNTHRDLVANQAGIRNVWHGRYRRLDETLLEGPSLRDLVQSAKPAQARQTTESITAAVRAIDTIQPPFDQEIRGDNQAPGRHRIQRAINEVKNEAVSLVASATALGVTRLTIVDPKKR